MEVETDLTAECEQLEAAAGFLRARANHIIRADYTEPMGYDFDRERALCGAAENLKAADRLQGRANMLRLFGRDYEPADYAREDE